MVAAPRGRAGVESASGATGRTRRGNGIGARDFITSGSTSGENPASGPTSQSARSGTTGRVTTGFGLGSASESLGSFGRGSATGASRHMRKLTRVIGRGSSGLQERVFPCFRPPGLREVHSSNRR